MTGLSVVTAIDVTILVVTVSVTGAETTAPRVAVIAVVPVVPAATDLARPLEPSAALLIEATERTEVFHVTDDVIFCVVWSVKVPIAVNWLDIPCAIDGVGVEAAIDVSVAFVTFSGADPETGAPETLTNVAVIVVDPVEPLSADVASPLKPDVLLIAATGIFEDFHVTSNVISAGVLPSE
jgi:hypothetical protein